jgi:hypothetical protein
MSKLTEVYVYAIFIANKNKIAEFPTEEKSS